MMLLDHEDLLRALRPGTCLLFGLVAAGPVASLRLQAVRRVRFGVQAADAQPAWDACRALVELADLERLPGASPRFQGILQGDPNALLCVLSALEVTELTVEEPDLEESVLRLYGDDAATERAEVTA